MRFGILRLVQRDETSSTMLCWNKAGFAFIKQFDAALIRIDSQLWAIIPKDDDALIAFGSDILYGIGDTICEAISPLLCIIHMNDRQSKWSKLIEKLILKIMIELNIDPTAMVRENRLAHCLGLRPISKI